MRKRGSTCGCYLEELERQASAYSAGQLTHVAAAEKVWPSPGVMVCLSHVDDALMPVAGRL